MLKIGNRRFLRSALISVAAGAFCGLVYWVSVPYEYDSAAVLLPEGSNTNVSMSNLRRMAAIMGRTVDSTPDAVKPLFYGDVVLSTPFLEEILDTRVSTLDGGVDTTLRAYLTDFQKEPWWGIVTGLPGRIKKSLKGSNPQAEADGTEQICLTEDEMELIQGLSDRVVADVAYLTRRMIIRVRMQDPLVAYQTASAIIDNLQKHIQCYRSEKNAETFEFIDSACRQEKQRLVKEWQEYAGAVDSGADISTEYGKMDLEQKKKQLNLELNIYTQMYIQAKIAELNADSSIPAFRVIQPPMVVLKSAEPRLWLCMLRFALAFLFVWVVFYIVKRPWE